MPQLLGLALLASCLLTNAVAAPFSVKLLTNKASPQPVGTPIGLSPTLLNSVPSEYVFRYSVSTNGGPFRMVRDFSRNRDFVWAPPLEEHQATLRVTVRNNKTRETASSDEPFRIVSRVPGATPVVTATAHPLVALFSAPPCAAGSQFRVAFRRIGEETILNTPSQPCRSGFSSNVYVAGMRPSTAYQLRPEVLGGGTVKPGAWVPFQTGMVDGDFPRVTVSHSRAPGAPAVTEPLVVHSVISLSGLKRPFAADLSGEIVWYARTPFLLTRVLPGGRFLALSEGMSLADRVHRESLLQEYDLAGYLIRETNAEAVADQLRQRGIQSDCRKGGKECLSGFHHEAIRLPNGHTLTIAGLERILPAGTQGAKEPVDIIGDLIIELDEDFQVAGLWNSFDHMDIERKSNDEAPCKEGPAYAGCPPVFLAAEAREWLHTNTINYIPSNGDFLISMPTQDWVAKIDYKNGKGSGKVLWRLGEGGDFQAKSDDPHPWFSFQHDSGFDPPGSNLLSIFDNGKARKGKNPAANSRGQVWRIDEESRTATLLVNADLGVFAPAVGSAHKLKNGGYTFEAGFINPASFYTRAIETDSDGKIMYAQQVDGVIDYRNFRVSDMYSAPVK